MPDQDLKVALIPHDIALGNVQANIDAVQKRILALNPDVDLVVLPEMFNTGFCVDLPLLEKIAENDNGTTIQNVRKWAVERGVSIWGSYTSRIDGHFYNRGFMAMPDGSCQFYNKRHLFRSGGESSIYTYGMEQSPIVNFRSWNLKMAICYDIRFPAWNRNIANNYDALIVPANWANARFYAWKHMLIARAIENQAYVAGCNREGNDIYGNYMRGDSQVFDHMGFDIADRQEDGTVYATFDHVKFNRDRSKFRPWMDADDFRLIID